MSSVGFVGLFLFLVVSTSGESPCNLCPFRHGLDNQEPHVQPRLGSCSEVKPSGTPTQVHKNGMMFFDVLMNGHREPKTTQDKLEEKINLLVALDRREPEEPFWFKLFNSFHNGRQNGEWGRNMKKRGLEVPVLVPKVHWQSVRKVPLKDNTDLEGLQEPVNSKIEQPHSDVQEKIQDLRHKFLFTIENRVGDDNRKNQTKIKVKDQAKGGVKDANEAKEGSKDSKEAKDRVNEVEVGSKHTGWTKEDIKYAEDLSMLSMESQHKDDWFLERDSNSLIKQTLATAVHEHRHQQQQAPEANLNYLLLTITVPTVLISLILITACYFSLQPSGRVCTRLFELRHVYVVNRAPREETVTRKRRAKV